MLESVVARSEKMAFRVSEFCHAYGIGRSKFYQEVAAGRLAVVKIGKLTLVSKDSAENWLKFYTDNSPNLPAGKK